MPTETIQLEDLHKEVLQIDSQLAAVRKEIDSANVTLSDVEHRRKELTVRLADGDRKAEEELAKIEQRKKSVSNLIEGLLEKAAKLDMDLKDAALRRTEASREVNAANARAKTIKLSEEVIRIMHNQIAHWRAGCRTAHELRLLLTSVEDSPDLSQLQKGAIRQAAQQLYDAQNPYNERWVESGRSAGGWQFTIAPKCPPDSLRHLEKLK